MKHSLRVCLITMLISAGVSAQEFSGIGDPSGAPGNPRSSYALSNVDHVNYYDGHVNVAIPVLTLGGRGSVSHTITIPIERTWEVDQSSGLYSPGNPRGNEILSGSYTSGSITLSPHSDPASGRELTYITWEASDHTQTILKDIRYNGLPQPGSVNRGRIFASTDGSDLVFYNDVDVIDGAETPIVNGTLITRDGMRYQFSADGYVRQIEDRNGNRITFSFQSTANGGIYGVTDAAGRTETINETESQDVDSQDVLTYSGYGGAPRTIKINYSYLGGALAAGESLQTFQYLFPELNGSSTTQFNPFIISSIELADQTFYTMKYNCYGELASLSLPTGGIYRYYYKEAGGATNGWSGVLALDNNSGYRISRPLLERDELADGVNVSAKMIFADQGSISGFDPQHSTRATTHSVAQFIDGPSGQLLRMEYHDFWGNSRSTAAPPTDPLSSSPWWEGIEFRTQIVDGSGILQTKEMVYGQRPIRSNEGGGFDPQAETAQAHDPQLCQVNTTLGSKTSTVLYQDDSYNNVSFQFEYDYGAAPPIGPGCLGGPPTATRLTWNTYVTDPSYTDPSVNLVSLPATTQVEPSKGDWRAYQYTYDEHDANHPLTDYPDIVGHDPSYGAAQVVRGNVTTLGKYANDLLTNGTEIYTLFSYDVAGNVTSVVDQNGHRTQFSYGDDHSSYAHATTQINAKGQQTTAVYDWSAGKASRTTDSNGVSTTYAYVDALERLTEMDQAVGAIGVETHTRWEYPNATTVIQKSDQGSSASPGSPLSPGDGTLQSESIYDGLGRLWQSIQLGDVLGAITTTTTYDALGRVRTVSNPVRTGSTTDPAGTTTQEYDGLNRPSRTTYQDGSAAVTMYSGNTATVQDPAGITRQLTYDGLGRLTTVVENPNQLNGTPSYTTSYAYDPIDDLIQVTQGAQVRTFVYSTLGWLDKSIQPELTEREHPLQLRPDTSFTVWGSRVERLIEL